MGRIDKWMRARQKKRIWRQLRPGVTIDVDGIPVMVVGRLPESGFRRDQYLVQHLATGQELIIAFHDKITIINN